MTTFISFRLFSAGVLFALVTHTALGNPYGDNFYDKTFRSPTNNIICQGDGKSEDMYPQHGVSCYIFKYTNKNLDAKNRKTCKNHWMLGYSVFGKGRGKYDNACYEEPFWDLDAHALPYGQTIKGKGWQCTSHQSGMICQNNEGHGFKLGRSSQKTW